MALEAAEVLGREVRTEEDVVSGALELRERGADTVVISRGPAGAIAVDGCHRTDVKRLFEEVAVRSI